MDSETCSRASTPRVLTFLGAEIRTQQDSDIAHPPLLLSDYLGSLFIAFGLPPRD